MDLFAVVCHSVHPYHSLYLWGEIFRQLKGRGVVMQSDEDFAHFSRYFLPGVIVDSSPAVMYIRCVLVPR